MPSSNDINSPVSADSSHSTSAAEQSRSRASEIAGPATSSVPAKAPNRKSERGFASMDPARQRAIASQGGKAAHQSGNAHEFTSDEAREAGRKGGHASHANRRNAAASRTDSGPNPS